MKKILFLFGSTAFFLISCSSSRIASVSVTEEDQLNVISWDTKREKGIEWFILERSQDGIVFTQACFYGPDELAKRTYEFKDNHQGDSACCYRLNTLGKNKTILETHQIFVKGKRCLK